MALTKKALIIAGCGLLNQNTINFIILQYVNVCISSVTLDSLYACWWTTSRQTMEWKQEKKYL